ncbi:MAG: NAD(P)/FAD-dependent oxidoreductase [Candidatus Hodarchaeota archaeon]
MQSEYDVVIVGAGPAGILAAMEIIEQAETAGKSLQVAIIERGNHIENRSCPSQAKGGPCRKCNPCRVMCGWGGSGAMSDGKLTLSPDMGGWLSDYLPRDDLIRLIDEVDERFLSFGAPQDRLFKPEGNEVMEYKRKALMAGLELLIYPVRHIGTENTGKILTRMYKWLIDKKVNILLKTKVNQILVENRTAKGVIVDEGEVIRAKIVVIASGREGANWLRLEAQRLGISLEESPVDVGVRVEIPAELSDPLTALFYDFKCYYHSSQFDQPVRSFCVCPHGEVVLECYEEVLTVNGHSCADKNRQTDYTNFALLVTSKFTEPFKEPIAYGKYIAGLANLLSDQSVIVQRLDDLKRGRRSTETRLKRHRIPPTLKSAIPGDLSFVLPHRHLLSILEMLSVLDNLIPGVNGPHTLVYGVEAKFYSSRLKLDPSSFETKEIKNLFAIGDGAGITRSLVQAGVCGIIAGRKIVEQFINHS